MPNEPSLCRICEKRRPRRNCPGVMGEICAVCCGTEREVTVDCPFDCEFLQEARRHDSQRNPRPEKMLHSDVEVTESFLTRNNDLLLFLGLTLLRASSEAPNIIDHDVVEALEGLVRTYRTLQSGLVYESLPQNPLAAAIHQNFQAGVQRLREDIAKNVGIQAVRDVEVLGVLVFLRRIADQVDNGRPRGRAFLHYLYDLYSHVPAGAPEEESPAAPEDAGTGAGPSGLILP